LRDNKENYKNKKSKKIENDPTARQIHALEEQAKILGEEGRIEEYNKVKEQIDDLKRTQSIDLKPVNEISNDLLQKSQQHQLRVCEICGCFLSKFESQERLEDHFKGKLHQGYTVVRLKLDELRKLKNTWSNEEEDRKSQERESPNRYRGREKRRSRSQDNDRDSPPKQRKRTRSKSKERRKNKNSKSPERDGRDNRYRKRTRSKEKRRSRF